MDGKYAYVADWSGTTGGEGVVVFDVSDPTRPQRAGLYDLTKTGGAVNVTLAGKRGYVVCYDGGFEVIDLSDPTRPQRLGVYEPFGQVWGVALSGTRAYLADAWAGFRVMDLSNPAKPEMVGRCSGIRSRGPVLLSANYAFIVDLYSLEVVDISDATNPCLVNDVVSWRAGHRRERPHQPEARVDPFTGQVVSGSGGAS